MTQIHDSGDAWHIGWDWHAHMWFVEPPFDVELDEPIVWFVDRDKAFAFVDRWIREQPVQASVVDEHLIDTTPAEPESDIPPALALALAKQRNAPQPEPKEPARQYANADAMERVSDYTRMVGLQ